MKNLLIFGGTSEGRRLAESLSRAGKEAILCVATEYGQELVNDLPGIRPLMGRLDEPAMEKLFSDEKTDLVVDATHPYAAVVTANIKTACEATGVELLRLLRRGTDPDEIPDLVVVDSVEEAAAYVEKAEGKVLLTTGIKELPAFLRTVSDRSRLVSRVLLQEGVFSLMEEYGLGRDQIICMQGPFSKEMNVATLRQVGAKILVTKEAGTAGGFLPKVEAAREAGAVCLVIRRPTQETGYSFAEVLDLLSQRFDCNLSEEAASPAPEEKRTLLLVGIGMGSEASLTGEAVRAFSEADAIIGAERMLSGLSSYQKPMVSMYKAEEIAGWLKDHPEVKKACVALSGDVGFYSGSKKLILTMKKTLPEVEVKSIPGISSVVCLASRLGMAWEDMALVSVHGRSQNFIGTVLRNEKTFILASKADSVDQIAKTLIEFGLSEVTVHAARDLSYSTEAIFHGKPEEFLGFAEPGLFCLVVENPKGKDFVVTAGIADEAFLRDKVPMTKEEIRSIALGKLKLTKDAVVYDVGSGTGSVSVECARLCERGCVYAIECKPEAVELTLKNRTHFGVPNLVSVPGMAPEALVDLPSPTHAFIGGSRGNLNAIVALLREKNPHVRIVITAIALETVAEALALLKELKPAESDIAYVSVGKSKEVGNYHMLMGQNPVAIITLQD